MSPLEQICAEPVKKGWKKMFTKGFMAEHLTSAAGILAVAHPVASWYETTLGNLSHASSQFARLEGTLLVASGLAYSIEYGREKSRCFFGVTEHSSARTQFLHDSLYFAAVNFLLAIPLYSISNLVGGDPITSVGLVDVAWKTSAISFAIGYPIGLSTDIFFDAMGIKQSSRVYNMAKKANHLGERVMKYTSGAAGKIANTVLQTVGRCATAYHESTLQTKRLLCGAVLAVSLAACLSAYRIVPDKGDHHRQSGSAVETIVPFAP